MDAVDLLAIQIDIGLGYFPGMVLFDHCEPFRLARGRYASGVDLAFMEQSITAVQLLCHDYGGTYEAKRFLMYPALSTDTGRPGP